MKFNVNNHVKVKLNDRGKEILKQKWDSLSGMLDREFSLPKEDEEIWRTYVVGVCCSL